LLKNLKFDTENPKEFLNESKKLIFLIKIKKEENFNLNFFDFLDFLDFFYEINDCNNISYKNFAENFEENFCFIDNKNLLFILVNLFCDYLNFLKIFLIKLKN